MPALPAIPPDLFDRVSLDKTLGIQYEELTADRVVATMPVRPAVHQPLGYLDGGAGVVLAESAASMGANVSAMPQGKAAFGLEINANHLRPKRDGLLRAVAVPFHRGRTTHVWEVRIYDEAEHLVCAARCTLALVEAEGRGGWKGWDSRRVVKVQAASAAPIPSLGPIGCKRSTRWFNSPCSSPRGAMHSHT